MTKEEIKKRIKECEAENEAHKTLIAKNEKEIAILREEFNKPEYGGKRWKPEMNKRYFYTDSLGEICDSSWDGGNVDEVMYAAGNVFQTPEAAEFELERRKVIAGLSDFAEGDDAVWDGTRCRYQLYYDLSNKCLRYVISITAKNAYLYFPSVEAAKAAVKAVGEERVRKYYLGVKE